jgi:hypothetical protein
MHIAHAHKGKTLSVKQIARLTGLKRRRIAELARQGEIPGAIRRDGYHFEYRVSPSLFEWIEWKAARVEERKRPKPKQSPAFNRMGGVLNIFGIRQEFDIWLRRVGDADGIRKMEREEILMILREIRPIARLYRNLAQWLSPNPT